jgi:hypothetical protein
VPSRIVALGHYEILYKDREKCIVVKNMGGFLLAVSHSLRREEYAIDFLGKTPEGKLWAMHFLLVPSSRRVMGVLVRLLRESRRAGFMHVADQWASSPLSVRVVLVAGGS